MKSPTPQTPNNTKSGSLDSFQEERETAKRLFNKLEQFRDDVQIAKMMAKDNGELLPVVECDRDLVEYHNRGSLIKGFDQVGYFIYEGAVICEKGQGGSDSAED